MKTTLLEWRTYRYFPYERDFARREVESLMRAKPRESAIGVTVEAKPEKLDSVSRLTYFARATDVAGHSVIPTQAKLEASAHDRSRTRQSTRYSAHGLHEYKGKF